MPVRRSPKSGPRAPKRNAPQREQRRDPRGQRAAPPPRRRHLEASPLQEGGGTRGDVIEGRNPVQEALRSGRPVNKILIAQDVGRHTVIAAILHVARERKVLVEHVDRRVIERLSSTGHSQGVLALAAAKAYVSLEQMVEAAAQQEDPALLVLLDGIEDPQNLGAIIRTAEGAGAHGVVIPERRAVGLTAAVGRASAGAIEYVPVAQVSNLSNAMRELGKRQVWTVGIDPSSDRQYTQVDFRQPTAIVIGGEGAGLSRLIKERCDMLASIPMRGKVASLNASVAAALVLYEALRQRRPPAP